MRAEAATPTRLVAPLLHYARSRGAVLDLAALGLPAEPGEWCSVSSKSLGALFEAISEAIDEPHLGLLLPAALSHGRYELAELAARSSATWRESLQQLTRFAPLLSEAMHLELQEGPGVARFIHRLPRGINRHLNELGLAWCVYACRTQTGRVPGVRQVRFMNPRPRGSLVTLQTYFGCTSLSFGHLENALELDPAVLDAPQLTADARLLATAELLAREALAKRPPAPSSFAARVEQTVRARLEHGEPTVRQVALALKMSTRTLQRRLEAEGTRYAQVLDGVRETLARQLVGSTQPSLSEVAFQLGFAEFATFSRAFKRWTGSAPGAFREQHVTVR